MRLKFIKQERPKRSQYKALETGSIKLTCDYPNPHPKTNPHDFISVHIKEGQTVSMSEFEIENNPHVIVVSKEKTTQVKQTKRTKT